MKIKIIIGSIILVVIVLLIFSCFGKLDPFSDQSFKTTIGLIELYETRNGKYPESLDSLTFLGDWDMIGGIEYKKLESGYEINYAPKSINQRMIKIYYPKGFWQGLGTVKSNLMKK